MFGLIAGIVASIGLLVVYARGKRKLKGRRMSFNSQVMVQGAFPTETKVATPIINVMMTVRKVR